MWLNTKDTDKQFCKFCEQKEIIVPAKYWCKLCMAIICDECKALQEFVPILKNHKIVNIDDTIEDCGKKVKIEELCPEREGKTIDAFCQIHQKLCCCICLTKHHRSYQLVEILADMAVETGQTDVQNILA